MSGTVIETLMDFVAWRVRVQREPVRDRMVSRRQSGVLERKEETREGLGSDWVAKRTVWRSSYLETVATVGSSKLSILTA